jgi:molybdate transport system permease protein
LRSAVVGLAAVALVLLALPLVALVVRTVEGVGGRDVLLMRPVASALALSLGTTSLSMIVVIILGTPLAYIFARYRFRFKQVLNTLIELPIVMPPVVAGLALLMAFGRRGLLGSSLELLGITLPFTPMAVVLAQVFVSAPFFIRTAQVRFQAIPREVEEAANIDGAGGWQTFWHVTLPLSLRGMLAGLLLSWARALGEFGATILFAGSLQGRTQTMPLLVYSALERDINAALWAGLLLVGMAAAALWLMRWLARAWDDGDDPLVEI